MNGIVGTRRPESGVEISAGSSSRLEFEPSLQNNLRISLNSVRRDLQIDAMANLATFRWQIIAYWVTTALVVFELALGGAWDLLRVPQVRDLIERLGYPLYFLVILGIWKLLGAVALVIPRFPRTQGMGLLRRDFRPDGRCRIAMGLGVD